MLIFQKVLHTIYEEICKDDPTRYLWFFHANERTIMDFRKKEKWLEEDIFEPKIINAHLFLCTHLKYSNRIAEILHREPQAVLRITPTFDAFCEKWLDIGEDSGYLIYSDPSVPYGKLLLKRMTQKGPHSQK